MASCNKESVKVSLNSIHWFRKSCGYKWGNPYVNEWQSQCFAMGNPKNNSDQNLK